MSIHRCCMAALLSVLLPCITFAQTDEPKRQATNSVPQWVSSGLVKLPLLAFDQGAVHQHPATEAQAAWTVQVESLDENGNAQCKQIELTGQFAVPDSACQEKCVACQDAKTGSVTWFANGAQWIDVAKFLGACKDDVCQSKECTATCQSLQSSKASDVRPPAKSKSTGYPQATAHPPWGLAYPNPLPPASHPYPAFYAPPYGVHPTTAKKSEKPNKPKSMATKLARLKVKQQMLEPIMEAQVEIHQLQAKLELAEERNEWMTEYLDARMEMFTEVAELLQRNAKLEAQVEMVSEYVERVQQEARSREQMIGELAEAKIRCQVMASEMAKSETLEAENAALAARVKQLELQLEQVRVAQKPEKNDVDGTR